MATSPLPVPTDKGPLFATATDGLVETATGRELVFVTVPPTELPTGPSVTDALPVPEDGAIVLSPLPPTGPFWNPKESGPDMVPPPPPPPPPVLPVCVGAGVVDGGLVTVPERVPVFPELPPPCSDTTPLEESVPVTSEASAGVTPSSIAAASNIELSLILYVMSEVGVYYGCVCTP